MPGIKPTYRIRQKRSKRPSVSLVGAGRLGTALAVGLTAKGYQLAAVVARRQTRALRTSMLLGDKTLALAESQLARLPPSDLIVISTPDDAIEQVARKLADLQAKRASGRICLHTSGALSSRVLAPLSAKGFAVGSLHPLFAVSGTKKDSQALYGAFWCVEGDQAARRAARLIVSDLQGKSFSIRAEKKALYHAAAVMASGHLVALFDIAVEMLLKSGLTKGRAREILLPLVDSTIRNLWAGDPASALTGTFARGDFATVQRHLRSLGANGSDDAMAAYKLLGLRSLNLAESNGANRQAIRRIRKLLDSSPNQRSTK